MTNIRTIQSVAALNNAFAGALTATAVKTSAYSAAAGDLIPVDATSGAVTVTLPTAPAARTRVGIKKIDTSTNAVTVSRGGSSDVFNKAGGSTSLTLALANQALSLQYSGGIWYVVGDDLPLSGLDARYARVGAVPSRPTLAPTNASPLIWAHRMGSYAYPEESDVGADACVSGAITVLDGDAQQAADGTIWLLHDSTFDRTTDISGDISQLTAPVIQNANAAAQFPWPTIAHVPGVGGLISRYGASTYLSIEPKNASMAGALMDLSDRLGGQGAVIINTFDPDVMTAAKARGYKVYFYWGVHATGPNNDGVGGTTITIAQAVAAGADFFGCDYFTQWAGMQDLIATGKPVLPFGLNRRRDYKLSLAAGVAGALSDQPFYLLNKSASTKTASWKYGVLGHGVTQYPVNTNLGFLGVKNGALVMNGAAGSNQYACVGELSPVANISTRGVTDAVTANGSPLITSATAAFTDDDFGSKVTGTGIPSNTYIGTVVSATQVRMSSSQTSQSDVNATATGTGVSLTIGTGAAQIDMTMIWGDVPDGGLVVALTPDDGAVNLANGAGAFPHPSNGILAQIKSNGQGNFFTLNNLGVSYPQSGGNSNSPAISVVGTLSAQLAAGVPVTSLPVNALSAAIPSGQKLALSNYQVVTTASAVAAAATTIPLALSLTPASTLASGSNVNLGVDARIILTSTTVLLARVDPAGTLATLSGSLTSGVAVTSLSVVALTAGISSGVQLYMPNGQIATTSAPASSGATSVSVTSFTPTSTIASGGAVQPGLRLTDSTHRGPYLWIGRTNVTSTRPVAFSGLTVSGNT